MEDVCLCGECGLRVRLCSLGTLSSVIWGVQSRTVEVIDFPFCPHISIPEMPKLGTQGMLE